MTFRRFYRASTCIRNGKLLSRSVYLNTHMLSLLFRLSFFFYRFALLPRRQTLRAEASARLSSAVAERRESRNECRSGYRIISMEVGSYERVQAFRTLLIFPFFPPAPRFVRGKKRSRIDNYFLSFFLLLSVAIRIDVRFVPLHRPDFIGVTDNAFPIVRYLALRQQALFEVRYRRCNGGKNFLSVEPFDIFLPRGWKVSEALRYRRLPSSIQPRSVTSGKRGTDRICSKERWTRSFETTHSVIDPLACTYGLLMRAESNTAHGTRELHRLHRTHREKMQPVRFARMTDLVDYVTRREG